MKSRRSDVASHSTPEGDTPAVAGEARDSRWPGAVMVLLMLLALVWPLGGLAAGAVAYFSADRDQGVALLGVAAVMLLLHRAFGG